MQNTQHGRATFKSCRRQTVQNFMPAAQALSKKGLDKQGRTSATQQHILEPGLEACHTTIILQSSGILVFDSFRPLKHYTTPGHVAACSRTLGCEGLQQNLPDSEVAILESMDLHVALT